MDNVEMKLDGDKLTIIVNLKAKGAPSASGKSIVIASTHGNATVPGTNVKVGLNVYRPNR